MEVTIRKWGDGLAVQIPNTLAEEIGLKDGMRVGLAISDGKLNISPPERPRLTLDALLAGITDDNLHPEQESGPARGREA